MRTESRPWPVPPLSTERLQLRAATDDDRPAIITLLTDQGTRQYLGGALDLEDAEAAVAGPRGQVWGSFLIVHAAEAAVIGGVSFSHERGQLEVSYLLLPDYWNQGYAAEAVRAALEWVVGHVPDDHVIAVTQAANGPSLRLLHRLGFAEVQRFTEWDAEQILLSRSLEPH